jgi:hypothetical protein
MTKPSSKIKKLTKEQGVVISGFTGILACAFSDFHKDVELRFGRSVFTHEFASKEFAQQIKELYRNDFSKMVK